MTDLIARLESAERGDRELSDEVLIACGWMRDTTNLGDILWKAPDTNETYFATSHPDPSRSMDDAIAECERNDFEWTRHRGANGRMTMQVDARSDGPLGRMAQASTPALALCAALIRALQARQATPPSE